MVSKKLVLTEDQELLSILGDSFFSHEGFSLITVPDGAQACNVVEGEDPAMAILKMAENTEELVACCRRIKADPVLNRTAMILILPEGADDDLADGCWDAGCDAIIYPPLVAGRLLDTACALLGINRRLAQRFPVSFELEFKSDEKTPHNGMSVNMNLGGIFVETEEMFPVDTRLLLMFTLPGTRSEIHCPVRVAWVNHPEWRKKTCLPCGMGVEFVDLCDESRKALQAFLDRMPIRRS